MISVELVGDAADILDTEFVKHAAAAVFHYFRDELDRESVTVAEFTLALEKILRGFNLSATGEDAPEQSHLDLPAPRVLQSDLCRIASQSSDAGELLFFPLLRDELRAQLRQSPQMLCFRGLRQCVKQLARAQRWTPRCQGLHDQIVEYLRNCMCREHADNNCALVVK